MRYLVMIFLLFSPALQAADITAQVDRNSLHMNESFQLVLEASGSLDAEPDFSVLEQDFDIVSRSQSSNISIINGNYKKTIKWSLTLMPREAGVITIPSVAFGKDRSPQLRITVKPASAPGTGKADDLYLEVEASTSRTYVQAQLVITIKMLSGENIARYGIDALKLEGVDAVVEQLGEDRQYRAYRGSKPYLVLERSYALFPQQPGQLRLLPLRGEVEISSGPRSMFDPFGGRSKIKRVRSRGLEIEVEDKPAAFSGTTWLPAAELQLVEEWPDARDGKPVFRVGEPVTRTLSILADGLSAAQLPELAQTDIDGIKQYPDQPSLHDNKKAEGIIGIREERIALIPTRPGRYTLPALEIPWWNVQTGTMEVARIAERQIQVAPGSTASRIEKAPPAQISAPAEEPGDSLATRPPARADAPVDNGPWPWISLLLAIAWLLTLVTWWWSRRQPRPSAPAAESRGLAEALKQLDRACRAENAAHCQRALIDWARAFYSDPGISNLGDIGRRAGEPLQSAIAELERVLYSDGGGDWNAVGIATMCRNLKQTERATSKAASPGLEPLYK